MSQVIKAPFPWFGGKSKAAPIIWKAFGDVDNYVEPFAGSLAVLLGREDYDPFRHTETVNDLDCFIANFWRSLQSDPAEVAKWADSPVNEADLHARHLWLINRDEFREKMKSDPDYFDPKIAGWWVWGLCCWIGSGWCKTSARQLPHLGNNGQGVHRQLPHLGNNGRGVHRKLPHLGDNGQGVQDHSALLYEYFDALANRLRRVRVCCGDWSRVITPAVTCKKQGEVLTGILLDPPYDQDLRSDVYAVETPVSAQVRKWAIANGDNPKLRIALCGYDGEHLMPDSWECVAWKAGGGYDGQNRDRDNQNRKKERIWFSPHCLKASDKEQLSLFAFA